MIGHRRKRGNTCNLMILMGRGLDYSEPDAEAQASALLSKETNGNQRIEEQQTSEHSSRIKVRRISKLCSCQGVSKTGAKRRRTRREAESAEERSLEADGERKRAVPQEKRRGA